MERRPEGDQDGRLPAARRCGRQPGADDHHRAVDHVRVVDLEHHDQLEQHDDVDQPDQLQQHHDVQQPDVDRPHLGHRVAVQHLEAEAEAVEVGGRRPAPPGPRQRCPAVPRSACGRSPRPPAQRTSLRPMPAAAQPVAPPSRSDPLVATASEVVGGPVGRYAATRTGPQPALAVGGVPARRPVQRRGRPRGRAEGALPRRWAGQRPTSSGTPATPTCRCSTQSSGLSARRRALPGRRRRDGARPAGADRGWRCGGRAWSSRTARCVAQHALVLRPLGRSSRLLVAVLVWVTAASRAQRRRGTPRTSRSARCWSLVALVSTDLLGVALASAALLAWSRRHARARRGAARPGGQRPHLPAGPAAGDRAARAALRAAARSFATLAVTALATVLVVTLPWLLVERRRRPGGLPRLVVRGRGLRLAVDAARQLATGTRCPAGAWLTTARRSLGLGRRRWSPGRCSR